MDDDRSLVRVFVHALDRTGPPRLALAFVEWLHAAEPDRPIEVVAFRGGALESAFATCGPTLVVLDDEEPWDHRDVDPAAFASRSARLSGLAPAQANLLVSVAAGQALPLISHDIGPIITWSVEIGDDLHWVDDGIGLRERTTQWLAGSAATNGELSVLLGLEPDATLPVVAEFVDPVQVDAEAVAALRSEVGRSDGELLIVGAGIGTHRKGMDLFVEAAVLHRQRARGSARFVWIGGERDPLTPRVRREIRDRGLHWVEVRPSTGDLDTWLAAADLFLHTARFDAFPLVCLHAAMVETPVVAFQGVGGVGEMFGHAFCGAPYPDIGGLVAELDALGDPSDRTLLGRRQRVAVDRCTTPVAAPRLLDAVLGTDLGSHR